MVAGLNPCFPGDFKYKTVSVLDVPWEDIQKYFASSRKFIKTALNNGGVVFVHCYAGVSRSAAIVCAYLMHEKKLSMFAALSAVKQKRPCAFPNPGFQRQLLEYEKKLQTAN